MNERRGGKLLCDMPITYGREKRHESVRRKKKIGFAVCGSFCTIAKVFEPIKKGLWKQVRKCIQ